MHVFIHGQHFVVDFSSRLSEYYNRRYHYDTTNILCEQISLEERGHTLTREDSSLLVPLMQPRLSFRTLISSS